MVEPLISLNFLAYFFPVVFFAILLFMSERMKDPDKLQTKRLEMVAHQIEEKGIRTPTILKAMRTVPRHLFVSEPYTENSYQDSPLPIAYGQTISQPYIVAYMIEKAQVGPTDRVLEIGTGSGYNAAVLSLLCKEVYSIEITERLSVRAGILLKQLGYNNVYLKIGDGALGWKEKAPFDAIIVTAAPDRIPQALLQQLKVGGRIVMPISLNQQHLVRIVKTPTDIEQESLFPVRFVPMQR